MCGGAECRKKSLMVFLQWGEIAGEVEVCLANKQQSSRMAELMDKFFRYYESQLDVITNTHEFPFLFRSPSFRVVVDVMLSFLT